MDGIDKCVICKESLTEGALEVVVLREKGSASVNRASEERHDSSFRTVPGQKVHQCCRRIHCNPIKIAQANKQRNQSSDTRRTVLRSVGNRFSFNTDCFYCGTPIDFGEQRRRSLDVFKVTTIDTKESVLATCSERKDTWADRVRARITNVHDLPAADAIYHQTCSVNFRTFKEIPKMYATDQPALKIRKVGRPLDEDTSDAFLRIAKFLQDNDDEQVTIYDLIDKMDAFLIDSESKAYGHTHMKARLKEYFGDEIIITEINGKANVVTFRGTAETVLQEFHARQKDSPEMEKMNIIRTAAKLIRNDIKSVKTSNKFYPESHEIESNEECLNYLPETLKYLLEGIVKGKDVNVKLASIGQAIMQAARPRVLLAPLQVGLAVQLHHHFASRFLIDSLHLHGFCCSYQEVHKFGQNAALDQGTDIPSFNSEFVQYVADNVDHNVRTLDGNDTFHGMGIIATVTPGTKRIQPVPRGIVTPHDISTTGHIPIEYHSVQNDSTVKIKYTNVVIKNALDPTANLDILWKTSLLFASSRPGWSGMMQFVHHGNHPGQSSVTFLPMIDMSSSDVTCIFSTLKFISEHARRHRVTPIITFDQPLWWKALMIIESEPVGSYLRKIVLRLGGFHTEMSFLGSIGHLMAGSGLKELLEMIYAPNAVDHMFTGKAIARAVRAHILVDAALNALILSKALGVPIPCLQELNGPATDDPDEQETNETISNEEPTPDRMDKADLQKARFLYNELMNKTKPAEEVSAAAILKTIKDYLYIQKVSMKNDRTAALWLQYMDMVDILRMFIRAERTGNWGLHLQAVSEMLPYLAASGHNLYTKSGQLYLQSMNNLAIEHPDVYKNFEDGFHVIRRSNRMWAGLSTDLVIEQVLMRCLKTSGGLTRGRGMTEQQRLLWLLSMPACAEVNRAMQEFTGVSYSTGEQNKDMTEARQLRDMKDTSKLLLALADRNPFTPHPGLRNIMNGINAGSSVNVDTARVVGLKILESMIGQSAVEYTFKRDNQVVTLGAKSSVKIDGEKIQVDPQLLFQRLVLVAKSTDDMKAMFKFELCSYPTALFDSSLMLRQPQKALLADAIWEKLPPDMTGPTGGVQYVLDGGALIHRIPWPKGFPTYKEICDIYCNYVSRKYGAAIVVFDGYNSTSTKDMTQQRRTGGKVGATVTFSQDMKVTMKKDNFLSNTCNKQCFINMLSQYLQRINCQTHHAQADADLLIVQAALESATMINTVLVGDDTDLLVLLCYHTSSNNYDLFFQPEPKRNSTKFRVWNMKVVKEQLGQELCNNMLFIHAIVGCDTTSHLHGIGKGAVLKRFVTSHQFREQAKVFANISASKEDVATAGEKALVCLYNGKSEEGLDDLRYKRYCEKLATKTSRVQPQSLPPTSAAARYHSLRVYFQIQQWKGVEVKPAEEWGWKVCDGRVIPIMTDLQAAPEALLRIVRCNCTKDCSSRRCTCRKHNLECSAACGQCRGSGCSNSAQLDDNSEDEDDEYDS